MARVTSSGPKDDSQPAVIGSNLPDKAREESLFSVVVCHPLTVELWLVSMLYLTAYRFLAQGIVPNVCSISFMGDVICGMILTGIVLFLLFIGVVIVTLFFSALQRSEL